MNLDFSEEQDMLRNSARQFVSTECTKAKVRELEKSKEGYSPEIWSKMAELGWFGLMIPDQYNGMGMKLLDLIARLVRRCRMRRFLRLLGFFRVFVLTRVRRRTCRFGV